MQVAAVNPVLKESLVDAIPISLIFEVMMSRVVPELTIETHQTALYVLSASLGPDICHACNRGLNL